MEEQEELAAIDTLTGLLNRYAFFRATQRALADALRNDSPFMLLLVEVDHVNNVNETLGGNPGDAALKILAQRLQAMLRPRDYVGRINNNRFGITLCSRGNEEATRWAGALIDIVADLRIAHQPGHFDITVNVGLADAERTKPETLQDIYRRADRALYRSKSAGRNQIQLAFTP